MPKKRNPVLWDVELLKRLYEDEGLSVEAVGKRLGVSGKVANKACKRAGVKMRKRGPRSGPLAHAWRGGVTVDKSGYILRFRPEHPRANVRGYVREHRLVMEQKLGRYLLPGEVVHHIDDDRGNNHPDNLELFESNGKHLAATLKGKCPKWTPEGREKILLGGRRKRKPSLPKCERDAQA